MGLPPKDKAASAKAASKSSSTVSGLARFLPAPIESISKPGMKESERARVLLVTVSRQLFVALASSIALGVIIALALYESNITSNVTLPIVMLCGIVGGFVGIQRRLKDLTIQDLELLGDSRIYLILSPFVGGVLAVVLYILFLSGLLKGDLFPTFAADTIPDPNTIPDPKLPDPTSAHEGFYSIVKQHAVGFSGYAKLMFWCFVAGFSERFVTDIIGKFEGNAVKTIK